MAKRFAITSDERSKFTALCKDARSLLILSNVALAFLLTLWHLVIADVTLSHPYLLLSAVITPALISLWASIVGSYKGAIGCCFISLFYFTAGVLNWTHIAIWPIGMAETLISSILFMSALMYARWKALTELPSEP